MKYGSLLFLSVACLLFTGCGTLQKATRHGLGDGYYRLTSKDTKKASVYAAIGEDSIVAYPMYRDKKAIDTTARHSFYMHPTIEHPVTSDFDLVKSEWDFDITTVLFKYRFSTTAIPSQLNANLNFAVTWGIRRSFFSSATGNYPMAGTTTFSSIVPWTRDPSPGSVPP